jgi:hypothetical protein
MSKVKQLAIALSAISLAGATSVGLAASGCGSSISPATATCLSQAATSRFINNYGTYLAGQGGSGSSVGSSYNGNPTTPSYSPPQNKAATPSTNNTSSKKPNINWF